MNVINVYGTVIWTTQIDINPEFVGNVIELSNRDDSVKKRRIVKNAFEIK